MLSTWPEKFDDLSRRRDKLSWSHHAEVASLGAPAVPTHASAAPGR
jgi:hypothetical protein